ncbi:MAG: AI-2E family transporter [Gemmatimonadaceae bacterium]
MPALPLGLTPLGRTLLSAASAVIVLAGLRAARPVVGPVVIALLLTIAWAPAANWLRRHRWPATVAWLTGIVLGFLFLGLFVLLVASSLSQLQDKLPDYQPRVSALQQTVAGWLGLLPFDASRLVSSEAAQPEALVGHALRLIRGLTATAGALGVFVFVMAFMMVEAVRYPEKLRNAIDTSVIGDRLRRFWRSMQNYVTISAVFGLIAGALNTVLLLALGVDFAILWGVGSFVLSFLPNIGFLLALVPPTALALIQFGFVRAAIVVAGFALINFALDNVIKPRIVGTSLDLSPAVVVLSLLFWSWLLGVAGALLAVPLSLGAKFLFENFDETRWIAHVMSDAKPVPSSG